MHTIGGKSTDLISFHDRLGFDLWKVYSINTNSQILTKLNLFIFCFTKTLMSNEQSYTMVIYKDCDKSLLKYLLTYYCEHYSDICG